MFPAQSTRARCGLFAALVCVVAGPVEAGQTPASPALVLSARAFGAVEKDDGKAGQSSSGVLAEMSYHRPGRRVSFDLRGSTQARHRRATGGIGADTQWLAAGIRARLSERTTLTAVQRLVYSPLYVPGTPGTSPASSVDATAPANQGVTGPTSITIASGVNVSRQMSRRTSAALDYGFDRVTFLDRDSAATSHRVSAAVERTLRRNLSLHVRYGYARVTNVVTSGASVGETHDLEVRAVYAPQFSRATTITFGVLPALTGRQEPVSQAEPAPARLRTFGMGGRVGVDHRFGRGWSTGVGYQRTIYYLQGSNQPILANAVSVRAQGSLGRRLMTTLAAAASGGTPTLQRSPARVTSVSASARVSVIAAGASSVYAEYRYEAYSSSGHIARLPGVERRFSRSAFRVGVAINFGLSPGRPAGNSSR